MSSIFDYKSSTEDLESMNLGISRSQYDQTAPTREVTGANFPNGSISFKWDNLGGTKHWLPSRSYIRLRLQIKNGAGTAQLRQTDNIAPAMDLCSTLFQSCEFRIQDKTVARVSDFVPQIDALETRLNKSSSWLKGIGKSSNFWDSSFKLRQVDLTSDGKVSGVTEDVSTIPNGGLVGGTAECKAATGVVTFANAQTASPWLVGDELEITDATTGKVYRSVVVLVASNVSLTIQSLPSGDIGATLVYKRYRKSPVTDDSRNVSTFELIWQPPLSVYKLPHALPPGARYELILTPQSNTAYPKFCIESLGADKQVGTDYSVSVIDMFHYTQVVEGSRIDNMTMLLDLHETSCQSEIVGTSNAYIQRNFDVSPSTQALTVCYQDNRCGSDTRFSASRFKSYNNAGDVSQELKLDRFMIAYAGQNLPAPDANLAFTTGTDFTVQRYLESQLYSGKYFDTGGGEEIGIFHERGQYLYFAIPRDGSDRSTRVSVYAGFGGATGADLANTRLLLFAHSRKVCRLQIEQGRVVDLQLQEA